MNENRLRTLLLAMAAAPSPIRGLLSILFALSALLFLLGGYVSLVLVFAVYALLEGTLVILSSFQVAGWPFRRRLLLFEGGLNLAIAVLTFAFPPFWSIALPWLMAAWASLTGLLNLVASLRSRVRKTEPWVPIWAGVVRLAYGGLTWFLPSDLPNIGNMSGHALVFLLLTAAMAILFGAVILAWWLSPRRGPMLSAG